MKVLRPGHRYELENFEDPSKPPQVLQFIEKRIDIPVSDMEAYCGVGKKLITVNDGTTNEEVLAMLIDRLDSLNAKLPNAFTSDARQHCARALGLLNARTEERKNRGVEGTPKP